MQWQYYWRIEVLLLFGTDTQISQISLEAGCQTAINLCEMPKPIFVKSQCPKIEGYFLTSQLVTYICHNLKGCWEYLSCGWETYNGESLQRGKLSKKDECSTKRQVPTFVNSWILFNQRACTLIEKFITFTFIVMLGLFL